ncbi:13734_t:CDS:2, partial [Racocetra persica]
MDDGMEDLYVEPYSETETISTTPSASSANSLTRKKRKTTSLVHPYIELLKKLFAPNHESGKTYDTYLNLIYGPQSESDKEGIEDSDSSTSEKDEILSGGLRQHWQYAHRQFRQKMRKENSEKDIDDFNNVEYLPAADTDGLLKKVRAAIFLSLDELWSAQSDLDNTGEEKDASLKLLQNQYDSAKDFQTRDVHDQSTQQTTPTRNCTDDDDDFFQALEHKESGSSFLTEKDEVTRYIRYRQIDVDQDLL